VSSKPDFVLHVGEEPPMWADVELLFEYTRSRGQEAVTKNSRSGCVMPGVYSTISLSAFTSMGSCLYSLVPMSATLITAASCTQSLSIS
jgi:hypothetical protein